MDLQLSDLTAPAVTIRPRTSEDLPAAAKILVDVHREDGYPVEGVSDTRSWLSPPDMIAAWVALLDNMLVAHVLLLSPLSSHVDPVRTWISQGQALEDVVVLARLFVHENARGRGIAKMLVQTATDWATREERRVLLDVMKKDLAAIRLYESFRWERVADVKHNNGQGSDFEALIYISPKVRLEEPEI